MQSTSSSKLLNLIQRLLALVILCTVVHFESKGQSDGETVVTITAIPGLQFDKTRFAVKPGARVKIILRNADDMSHNLVVTKPAAREIVVNAAMKLEEKGPELQYVPESSDVLWSIPVIAPGQEGTVSFTAPQKTGAYPYVCTFPGHGFYMFGAMYVQHDDKLPPIENDPNIPGFRKNKDASHAGNHAAHALVNHPYETRPPFLYRAYMEDSSPASIAVHLPQGLSYCWDAASCELRYAWTGEFVDNAKLWKGKPNAVSKVLGDIFYRNSAMQALRIGDPTSTAKVKFKGYKLVDRYPEFHYTLDGLDVYELIREKEDGTGLVRTFRVPNAPGKIWFLAPPSDGVIYSASTGAFSGNKLLVEAAQASNFTITMTKTNKR